MASYIHRFNFNASIDEERGELKTPGIDWGRPLKIIHRAGDYVIARCGGHATWSGVGMPWTYAPSTLMLIRTGIVEDVSALQSLDGVPYTRTCAEVIEEIEPGRRWKKALDALIASCNALAKETTP